MPAAYTSLLLTDGTIGADLVDNVNYALRDGSFSPAVSRRRKSRQAGKSPYYDVVQEITVDVLGSSGAVALANLAKLTQLLDLADQFAEGELVAPVVLECQPQGSVLTNPVTALVGGWADGQSAESFLNLPVTFSDFLHQFVIEGVTLRFLRSGLWYGDLEEPSAAEAAENPSIQTVTFSGSLVIPGPTTLAITGFGSDTADLTESWLFVASENGFSPDQIQIVEGETGSADASGVTLTATDDSANNARGDDIAEITDPSTTAFEGVGWLLAQPVDDKKAYILMACRNNTAATWYVKAATRGSSGQEGQATEVVKILGSNNDPQIVPLGMVFNSENHAAIRMYFKCSTTSGSPQLDIDYIAILGRDNQHNYVLHVIPGAGVDEIDEFAIDPEALTAIAPSVKGRDLTILPADYPLGYDGDMWLATVADVSVAWFATRTTKWRWSVAAGTVLENGLTLTRRPGYLTPQ